MSSQVLAPALQQHTNLIVAAAICGTVTAMTVIGWPWLRPELDAFPTVGSNTWSCWWWIGGTYATNTAQILQQGYDKYRSEPFKIAYQHRWMVILNKREHVEQVLKTPQDELSFRDALSERLNLRYTVGHEGLKNADHAVRALSQLTRHTRTMHPDMMDEIVTAFDELLDLKDDNNEWKCVPALSMVQQVVCRASNRVFVGLPLCRDPDYIDLNLRHATDVQKAGLAIGKFPKFMRSLAAHFLACIVAEDKARALKHLRPIIEKRLEHFKEYGNAWTENFNDLLTWLIEEGEGAELTVEGLVLRILIVNLSAIYDSSHSFTHVLYYLAANPQYIQPLREEIETVIEKEGWTKSALEKMTKIDSFLRECQRLEGASSLGVQRKAMKDITFSDGTFIPKGTVVGTAIRSLQRDDGLYENANTFEPFRFDAMRGEDEEDAKYRFTSTGIGYLPFGHGKRACPGRFFVAAEMKIMLAHIVTTYDVKLEDQTTRPASLCIGTAVLADPHANLLFKRRVD